MGVHTAYMLLPWRAFPVTPEQPGTPISSYPDHPVAMQLPIATAMKMKMVEKHLAYTPYYWEGTLQMEAGDGEESAARGVGDGGERGS